MAKPSSVPGWTSTTPGSQVEPLPAEKVAGWAEDQRPPAQYFNWFWSLVSSWIDYLNNLGAHVLEWSAAQTFVSGMLRVAHLAGVPAGFRIIQQNDATTLFCFNVSAAAVTRGGNHLGDTLASTLVDTAYYGLVLELTLHGQWVGIAANRPLIRLWACDSPGGAGKSLFSGMGEPGASAKNTAALMGVRAFGLVAGAGGLFSGSDGNTHWNIASAVRTGPGDYTITLRADVPTGAILATVYSQTAPDYTIQAIRTGSPTFRVQTRDGAGVLTDCPFSFAVLGY